MAVKKINMKKEEIFDLSGKVAIVTGGAGHLGTAMSEALREAGAEVIVASRNSECKLDISSRESIKDCFADVAKKYGKIDILVNNASYGAANDLEHLTDEEWQKSFDGIVASAFRTTQEIIPYMKESGGAIINIASMYGIVSPDLSIYGDKMMVHPANTASAKAALIHFTKYCAVALAKYKIRVNAISPGPFPKPEVEEKYDWFIKKLSDKNPTGRIGQPDELKGAVVFLASDSASYVTGHNLVVDGGWTIW